MVLRFDFRWYDDMVHDITWSVMDMGWYGVESFWMTLAATYQEQMVQARDGGLAAEAEVECLRHHVNDIGEEDASSSSSSSSSNSFACTLWSIDPPPPTRSKSRFLAAS